MFVQALRYMGEDDLLYLNRMVVERLNLLAQARSTVQLAQFAEGDRVEFTTHGHPTEQEDGQFAHRRRPELEGLTGTAAQTSAGLITSVATNVIQTGAGCQRCASSSSIRLALCVGSRVRTSFR